MYKTFSFKLTAYQLFVFINCLSELVIDYMEVKFHYIIRTRVVMKPFLGQPSE